MTLIDIFTWGESWEKLMDTASHGDCVKGEVHEDSIEINGRFETS